MIVALAGRRIDASDAKTPVFPLALVEPVKRRLINFLHSANATHLVSSGACGADLLALQAANELLMLKTMILPFDAATFRSTSVTDRPGNWGLIYDKMVEELNEAGQLKELNYDKNDPEVYIKANFHILDEAQKIAQLSDKEQENNNNPKGGVMALIVWEGRPKNADDTTYHFMQEARKRNFSTKEILIIE